MSRIGRCEHGRTLGHASEPTSSTAATSGRPSGLHPTACHTPSRVAPLDPGARATQVGGFVFGLREPQLCTHQVRAEHTGIRTITGELMGKSKVFPRFPPVRSGPPPYPLPFFTVPRIRPTAELALPSYGPYAYGRYGTNHAPHSVTLLYYYYITVLYTLLTRARGVVRTLVRRARPHPREGLPIILHRASSLSLSLKASIKLTSTRWPFSPRTPACRHATAGSR